MMLTNKHVVAALVVTPVLSLIAWFSVDYVVREKPHPAVSGSAYPLVAQPNCRYSSGSCELVNASFRTTLTVDKTSTEKILRLSASFPLDAVFVGFADSATQEQPYVRNPFNMLSEDGSNNQRWSLVLDALQHTIHENTRIFLVMLDRDTYYYAQTVMAFSENNTAM